MMWITDLVRGIRERITFARTPLFQQIQASECGAASLGIVLAHHGCWVSINELRRECGISRDGCSAADIQRAARKYGMEVVGQKLEPRLLRTLELPIIIFWEFNHFLVLEGFRGRDFLVNDPANGHRRVREDEFNKSYTGIALEFKPGPDFRTRGQAPRVKDSLWPWFKSHALLLAFAATCGLLTAIPGLGVPILLSHFVDTVLAGDGTDTAKIVMAVTALALAHLLLTWLQQRVLRRVSLRVAVAQAQLFISTLLRLPNEYFIQRFAGELASRTQLIDNITRVGSTQLTSILIELVVSCIFLIWMIYSDVWLGLFILLLGLVNLALLRVVSGIRLHENYRIRQEQGKLVGLGTIALKKLDSIRAMGMENSFFARWTGYQARELISHQRFAEFGSITIALPSLTQALGGAVVLGVGTLRIFAGSMTLGEMMAFFVVAGHFLAPIGRFVDAADRFNMLDADLQRVDDVKTAGGETPLSRQEEQRRGGRVSTFKGKLRLAGHLELRNLSFGYRKYHPPLFTQLNLVIEPGQRVAVIGPSGSGKSTLAMLVAGIREPWTGEILFDGAPREKIPHEVMSDSVAFVDQHVALFSATIRENLTMWNTTVPDDMVVTAAKDAWIHEEITKRRLNYEGAVLEGGLNFSGGQRQRLEIARALLYNPSLLILDEATSDLDPALEKRIDDSIRRRGCSCLVIAHRLSTIRDCDEIIVMNHGGIVQRGRHEELMQEPHNDLYRTLVTAQ